MEAAEVRRLHIIYFLSRKGRIEHPHLIRVHHLSRNGIRLRDIKRWLGELRGKDMPESYSWSYKRRYKTGYVWQDLLDDDLITPISDNEYVLKGSEISSNIKDDKFSRQKDQSSLQEEHKTSSDQTSCYVATKASSEIEESSPTFGSETSTVTDDSGKIEIEKNSDKTKHEKQEKKASDDETEHSSPFAFLSKKSKKKSNKVTINDKITITTSDSSNPSSSETHFTKSKSQSNGATNMLRNLISCGGAVETNDSAVLAVNKQQNKPFFSTCSSDLGNVNSAEICKRDIFGGSQRVFGTPSWTQQQWGARKSFDGVKDSAKNKDELREQRALFAAYKPVNVPNCSQCGKPFKPDKLHAHMKSCKGMKAMSKSVAANAAISAAAEKTSKASTESRTMGSVSGRLLGC